MTGLDRTQTPKTRQMPHKRGGLVACLDLRHPCVKLPGFGRIGLDLPVTTALAR